MARTERSGLVETEPPGSSAAGAGEESRAYERRQVLLTPLFKAQGPYREEADDLETTLFASAEAFERWLDTNHASSPGIWLKLRKKAPGVVALDYAQALDVALCYGWIDGQKGKFDDSYWLQRFTPRRPRSRWSKINRDKADALLEQGRMQPSGLAEVERAKADGRWDAAYDGWKSARVPDDLAAALTANPAAARFFATLDGRNRYAIRYRVQDAKKPETRVRRIEKYVAMLAECKRLYP